MANRDFVVTIDSRGAEGTRSDYGTHIFEKGDKFNLSVSGGMGADGAGGD